MAAAYTSHAASKLRWRSAHEQEAQASDAVRASRACSHGIASSHHELGEDEGAAGGRVTPVTRPSGARSAGDGRVTGVSRPGTRRPEPQLYSRIDSDCRKGRWAEWFVCLVCLFAGLN